MASRPYGESALGVLTPHYDVLIEETTDARDYLASQEPSEERDGAIATADGVIAWAEGEISGP